jgi:hypothetical protein
MSEPRPLRPSAPPLPPAVTDLDALWKNRVPLKSLNDIVQEIHRRLWSDPEYRRYLEAIWPEEAVEGSFIMDDSEAARMIRKYDRENGHQIPEHSDKLSAIVKSLHVVLRRYKDLSRQARRALVMGESVESDELHGGEQ